MYGAQLVTVVVQFLYAAVTSRTIDPAGFGYYAISLAVSGLLTLLAVGGLAQSVSRMDDLAPERLRSLVTYAAILGLLFGLFMWFTAPLWAALWGEPEAASIIRWLALGTAIAPLAAISGSLLRRQGRFRTLAIVALGSNVAGMALGVAAVVHFKTPDALVVSPIVAQLGLLICSLALSGRSLFGFARISRDSIEVAFSAQLVPAKLADYVIGNVAKFGTSRWVGVDAFGFWNRGDVVTSLPLQQIQTAIIQTVTPEFRHDISDSTRAKRVWTDMLILISWVALPLAALAAVVVPFLVPLLFGPGWETTGQLVPWLAVGAGLQMLATVLASAVEILGRMRWIWATAIILLVIQVCAAVALFVFRDLIVAMIFLVLTQAVRHAVNIWQCGRRDYLNVPSLMSGYFVAAISSVALAASAWAICSMLQAALTSGAIWWAFGAVGLLVATLAILLLLRKRLPPVKIAADYGISRPRRSTSA
jgi:O-antigen/teichoic acid export membrane protein